MSNVSIEHEAPLDVLRHKPTAVLELLRLVGRSFASVQKLVVEVVDSELTEATPSARRADLVVLLRDSGGRARRVVVVEVQRDDDDEKLFAWPLYIAYLNAFYRLPATLLVLTFDATIATWAGKRRRVGSNMMFAPHVLGPDDLPEIPSVEEALAHPELSVLTALAWLSARDVARVAHHEAEIERVFEAMFRNKDARSRDLYLSLLHDIAPAELRSTIDKLKEAYGMSAVELIFAKGKAEGKVEGKAEGKAEGEASALLKVLRGRGLTVDAAAETRIRETRDLALLDRWLDRALTARTTSEVLAD